MLNRSSAQEFADLIHDAVARCPIVVQYAYFDEFVSAKTAVNLGLHRWRNAATPHQYHRLQGMRAAFQASTICGRQLWRHRALLKKAF